MKRISQIAALFVIIIFLNGCTINTTSHCYLKGKCSVTQADHTVNINADGAESFFHFSIGGTNKPTTLDSIAGSYKYKSKTVQPLQLVRLNINNAIFSPTAADLFVAKPPAQLTRMNFGRYDLSFEYVLNGQTNLCGFNVKYVEETKIHVVPFWAWFAYFNAYKNYGEGP